MNKEINSLEPRHVRVLQGCLMKSYHIIVYRIMLDYVILPYTYNTT